MRLQELTDGLSVRVLHGRAEAVLTDLVDDSRRATAGCAFLARAGCGDDGRRYADDAMRRGAAAVIEADRDDPLIIGRLAERFFGEPAAKLRLVAVTGTNGKSTTCFLIQHLLSAAGIKCGLLGTVIVDDGAQRRPAELTTPGSIELSRILARMVAHGCAAAACEVSSHALHQGRAAAMRFDVAVFTNLTGDHLDYHRTMDAYADAKAMLFESLDEKAWAILNRDDAYAERMARDCKARVWWTSLKAMAEDGEQRTDEKGALPSTPSNICFAAIHALQSDRSRATFKGPWGEVEAALPLVGRHNVSNALQAIAAGNCITALARSLREALPRCPQVPGRLERVTIDGAVVLPTVLVDYAHTHDSLENVLNALRPIAAAQGGRLICLFGCGGDRDRTKRPKMAQVAVRLADEVIVTSDNPRTEDPDAIIRDILAGIPEEFSIADKSKIENRKSKIENRIYVEPDRAKAIHRAIASADERDTVLLAGKGHEDYQIIGQTKRPFDDRRHAAAALRKWITEHPAATPGGAGG